MVKPRCCWRARNETKRTSLPWAKVLVVGSVTFIDAFGGYLIFAFLPFMLHSFFPNLKAEQIGYKAGILAGSYYVGSLVGNPIWGWVSDLLGRRPVLLLGVCGTVLSELLFGFSLNFIWAVAARFLWGVLNGYLFGAAKVYMTEITDDSNQAMAFAIMYAGTGGGKLLGPVAGGFLARPASKYEVLQVPFFCKFPYALPCLVGAAISILSFIASYFILAEPKKWGEEREAPDDDDSDDDHSQQSGTNRGSSWMRMGVIESGDSGEVVATQETSGTESDDSADNSLNTSVFIETNPLLPDEREQGRVDLHNSSAASPGVGCMSCKGKCTPHNVKLYMVSKLKAGLTKLKKAASVLHDRRVFLSITLYVMLSFSVIVGQELFSLLMVTNHAHGGYSMDGNEIGTILMIVAVCEFAWQLSVFPLIVRCIGYRWTLRLGLVLFALSCVLLPFSNQITGPIPNMSVMNASLSYSGSGSASGFQNSTTLDYCGNDLSDEMQVNINSVKRIPIYIWVVVVIFLLIMVVSRMVSFATLAVLTGNSTLQSTRGTVYGLSEGLTGVSSALGPIVITPLFAWSENNGLSWPLNFHFVFYLLAASGLLGAALALFLPKSIEKKRETEVENSDQ